jgi:mRNA-degrading endonuclease RelE of RelBE toxin-antitoxin system
MWTIKIDSRVEKELKKLDKVAQKKIINYLKEKVIT